ncbi:hypothetical protein BC831DRAFT_503870 [Entophlyctis helioformis]|nr:hypothetical protein BC831DRAFT_503870 [Entophlyctis helioformis]
MAPPPAQPPAADKKKNAVHEDCIWRLRINSEMQTPANWERTWGFMREDYQATGSKAASTKTRSRLGLGQASARHWRDTARQHGQGPTQSGVAPAIASQCRPRPTQGRPHQVYLLSSNVNQILHRRTPMQKYYLPTTTSHAYGWRYMPEADMTPSTVPALVDPADALRAANRRDMEARLDAKRQLVHQPDYVRERWSGMPPGLVPEDVEAEYRDSIAKQASQLVYTLEKFGTNARRRRDVQSWWGGCMESLY